MQGKDAVARLLIQPRLWIPRGDYPGHLEWRDKAVAELENGQKMAIVAFMGGEAVGSITYQQHKSTLGAVELKNISIEPAVRGRHFASFLLRQAEIEAQNDLPGVYMAIGDTKASNTEILAFMASQAYAASLPQALEGTFAHNGVPDVVFTKNLRPVGANQLQT